MATDFNMVDGAVLRVQRNENVYHVDQYSSNPIIPLKAYEINWGFKKIITIKGHVDTDTFEAAFVVTIVGIDLTGVKGNLTDGIILKLNLVAVQGTAKLYLKGKQLRLKLDARVLMTKYEEDIKILDLGSAKNAEHGSSDD